MAGKSPIYPHRRTKDGSYISICMRCFERIARCKTEDELAEYDQSHICDSTLLAERGCFGRADSMRHSDRILAPGQPG